MGIVAADDVGREYVSRRVRLAQAAARVRSDISFAFIDAIVIAVAYSATLILRFVDVQGIPENWLVSFAIALPVVVAVHLLTNLLFGAYGHVWEYASIEEAMRLVYAAAVASAALVVGVLAFRGVTGGLGPMPLTVMLAGSLVALGGMGALRFRSRLFSFKRSGNLAASVRILVVGTGRSAAELARHTSTPDQPRSVVGFLALDDTKNPRRLAGCPVLGSLNDIVRIIEDLSVQEVIVAAPLDDGGLRDLVDACMEVEVRLRILPDMEKALSDASHLTDIRDLELNDLLPRPDVAADLTGSAGLLDDTRVLVTGAGGSIGSEIVRQLLELSAEVTALDHDETLLHDALLTWPHTHQVEPVLCDIRDEHDLGRAIDEARPEVVFHAAALKHVPILEKYPVQAVKTNVLGTAAVVEASRVAGVSRFVLISTDKAVNPEGVLGSTKRIAEMIVQSAAAANHIRYGVVRFGNVLGSRGSVVPTFVEQIRHGGPVTITDPEMTRYFMTVDEAVGLVLQAAALSENGEIFVLDMGEPARIEDLAHRMIRLAGLVPHRDIDVIVTGPRPGEKISEALSVGPMSPSLHPRIRIANPGFPGPATMFDILRVLKEEAESGTDRALRKVLREISRQDWHPDEVIDITSLEQFTM